MVLPEINYCPGTLVEGVNTYSKSCLKQMFNGKKVSHLLSYENFSDETTTLPEFLENQKRVSVSGVQEKYSVVLDKTTIRLTQEGEQGTYILKTAPFRVKNAVQMPANEHLTLQIAQQIFGIETAPNCLVFFKNGDAALLVKRFDIAEDGKKMALEDFASLAGKTPQTHGEDYKYHGNYLELFETIKKYVPAYKVESLKLFKMIVFNYLFSNGDAHLKNFSLLETLLGDYRLSPAYDLLNSRIHIEDKDFALNDGLLPRTLAKGKVKTQILTLAEHAEIQILLAQRILFSMMSDADKVQRLISASYLDEKIKRNYLQAYQTRLAKLQRD